MGTAFLFFLTEQYIAMGEWELFTSFVYGGNG
jgi:hypothetical protein